MLIHHSLVGTAYKEDMEVAALSASYLKPQLKYFCKTPQVGLGMRWLTILLREGLR